jgi:transgelin
MSPSHTGASNGSTTSDYTSNNRTRGASNADRAGSPVRPNQHSATSGGSNSARPMSAAFTGPSSILYSGYMGGASQGNQGISFGARRQITTPAPHVPSLAEKERRRREKEAEDERARLQAEDDERKRRLEREEEQEQERIAEQKRWEEETKRIREEEKRRVEQQKREWEEQERRWKADEEKRLREERESQVKVEKETQRSRGLSDPRLRGQMLSQYQAEQKTKSRQTSYNDPERTTERDRIYDLERQLDEAKERERQYEEERSRRDEKRADFKARSRSRSRPRPVPQEPPQQERVASWTADERDFQRKPPEEYQPNDIPPPSSRPLPTPVAAQSSRPLPQPTSQPISSRPLPNPSAYAKTQSSSQPGMNRTERYLSQNPAPIQSKPTTHYPSEIGLTSEFERRAEDSRRQAAQVKTKASGWASKSLLEREMERERERQREWEAAQSETRSTPRDASAGPGAGQSWDVNQYGYIGGDSQNKVGTGIGFGAKRQIIGPRPPP